MFNKKNIIIFIIFIVCFDLNSQISINESSKLYLSPNGDKLNEIAVIKFSYSELSIETYGLIIKDSTEHIVKEIKSKKTKKVDGLYEIEWDGKNSKKELVKDGIYKSIIYIITKSKKRVEIPIVIIFDTTKPVSNISCKELFISPNYDDINDKLLINQSGSKEVLWLGEFIDSKGSVVKTYKWKKSKPKTFSWDGFSDYNRKVSNGIYTYRLYSTDLSGNTAKYAEINDISVDGSTPKIKLLVDNVYFSPNGDGKKDIANVKVNIGAIKKVVSYKCLIINDITKKSTVLAITNPKDGFSIDGSNLDNGFYTIVFSAVYLNGFTGVGSTRIHLYRDISDINVDFFAEPFYRDEEKNFGKFEFITSAPYDIIFDKWDLEIRTADGNTVFKRSGNETLESRIVYQTDHYKAEEYTIKYNITDKNGNRFKFSRKVNQEIEFIKENGKLYFDTTPIIFNPYETKIEIDKSNIDRIISLIDKYPERNIIIESEAFDDGNDPDILRGLSRDRADFVRNILLESGINGERLKIFAKEPNVNAVRKVTLRFEDVMDNKM